MDQALTAKPFAIFLCLVCLLASACQKSPMGTRWMVYYGKTLSLQDYKNLDLVILDPGQMTPPVVTPKPKALGYLSVGEAEDYRSYWPKIKDRPFVVEPNPQWPGAIRIDLRAAEWRALVLDELIPGILAKGFDGVFLDTIDTAPYLEQANPEKFAGSSDAAVALVAEMHRKFPQMVIVVNNGLEILPRLEGFIDGVTVEDVYTRYDFETHKVGPTPEDLTRDKEKILDGFRSRTGKPVLNILYQDAAESVLSQQSVKRSEEKGYLWYLTTVDLMQVGTTPAKSFFK